MPLYRFPLIPESAWRTPWQSDTLAGMICGAVARLEGGEALRREIIDPALAGKPPFVLSDAFPGDWLPVPAYTRLLDWPPDQRKTVKRARWLKRESFDRIRDGQPIALEDFIKESGFHETTHLHNTISRSSHSTSDGGSLYSREETHLAKGLNHLTVYVRLDDAFRDLFWRALGELAACGYGADRSAGKGQFCIAGELEPVPSLDRVNRPNGVVALSTFQPEAGDPTDGAWEAFTKYGKLGPEFGLENVFKRPLVLLKPGASFRISEPRPWLGRAIRMNELLAKEAAGALTAQGVEVIHYAYSLVVPVVWPTGNTPGQPRPVATAKASGPIASSPGKPSMVEVTLLERMEKTGSNAFRVQEEGCAKGMLNHGTPPDPLPAIGAKVVVYREPSSSPRSPNYRWTPPDAPARTQPFGKSAKPRR
jgi:CRISPR-associated protein Csm4